MRGEFLIADLLHTPWALQREVLSNHVHVLARWVAAGMQGQPPMRAMDDDDDVTAPPVSAFEARRREANDRIGGGGILGIPVFGTIVQRAGMMTEWCGGTACTQVSAALRQAMADETVGQILLEFDSPGGSVYGIDELAAEIYEARKTKPIVGIANSLSASAAYYLMSQCSECYVTPSGEAGSIGVYMAHEDWSKAYEEAGIKVTIVKAGKYKAEGNPYEPLSEEALAYQQKRVDEYMSAFVKAVARGRGVPVQQVRDGMGEGRVLGAADAKAAGMVDDVMPLADVIRKMQRDARTSRTGSRSASLDVARAEIEALR